MNKNTKTYSVVQVRDGVERVLLCDMSKTGALFTALVHAQGMRGKVAVRVVAKGGQS